MSQRTGELEVRLSISQWLRDTTAVLNLWLEPALGHPSMSRGQHGTSTAGGVLVIQSPAPWPWATCLSYTMLATLVRLFSKLLWSFLPKLFPDSLHPFNI